MNSSLFNDPIYGFISIPDGIIFELIEHPYFQRLRRIKQLGLTNLVYSGAHHTRFHHAIGAMHLMQQAIKTLRFKGHNITPDEEKGVLIAILLHDIGHGPFSHALEHSIVKGISHEVISLKFMHYLNDEFNGELTLAIEIFKNKYHKKFLHQLVSSQLDMDRLDYLKRDSFFSGVADGEISSERIIKTLNIKDDQICVEAKGIYSVENFIVARMAMYWQVYLHKTVISAEFILMNILKRAKELAESKTEMFCTPTLRQFIYNSYSEKDFDKPETLEAFSKLDDVDVMASIKVWANHSDKILSKLCTMLVDRKLYKIKIQTEQFTEKELAPLLNSTVELTKANTKELPYFYFEGAISNSTYSIKKDQINILFKDGSTKGITYCSDLLNFSSLSEKVEKNYVCYLGSK